MNVAEHIVARLHAEGIDTLFGIPGNHNLAFHRALAPTSIDHVTARHEQGAGFMADGYARATGRVGVCLLISGPGVTNVLTAAAQALGDSSRMLIIATESRRGGQTGLLHALPDQLAVAHGVCRAAFSIDTPEDTGPALDNVFAELTDGIPGPVYLQVPTDVVEANSGASNAGSPTVHRDALVCSDDEIQQAADVLAHAASPLIVVGGGAADAGDELRQLLSIWPAPVLNTVNAKGLLPASHPLHVGGSPSLACHRAAFRAADAALIVGSECAETDYDLLMQGDPTFPETVVRIDCNPQHLHTNVRADVALCGDAARCMAQLAERLSQRPPDAALEAAGALRRATRDEHHYHRDFETLFRIVESHFGEGVVVGDSCRPTYYATWMYEPSRPRSYFHSVAGYGTLGFAIPAAIGAALARPDDRVLGIIGDGGAQFTIAELAVAAHLLIGVTFLIWNNNGYAEIVNSMAGSGTLTQAAEIEAPDFQSLSSAFDCDYIHADSFEDLDQLFSNRRDVTAARGGPLVVEVTESALIQSPSGQWY